MTGPRKGPSVADINTGLDLLADQLRAEGFEVLEVNHLPHTEPESLDAWARRTAPTLTDHDWRCVIEELDDDMGPALDYEQWEALRAELDRIAGELTPSHRGALRFLEQHPRSSVLPIFCSYEDTQALVAANLAEQHPKSGEVVTPLGRAVLAREAAQR